MDRKENSGAEAGFDHVNVQNRGSKGEQLHDEGKRGRRAEKALVVSFQDFESGRRIQDWVTE